jgi:endoglycosylceramidase
LAICKPAVSWAFDNFWQNTREESGVPNAGPGLWQRYADAWKHVATRFAQAAGVLGYELMNEPFPGSLASGCWLARNCENFEPNTLGPFYQMVIDEIREADPATPIFVEPNLQFTIGVKTHLPRLNDSNLVFSFHPYENQYASTEAQNSEALRQATSIEGALMATEWGASTNPANIRATADVMDRTMMSWLYWTWANKTPYRMSTSGELPSRPEDQGIVQELSRPRTPPNLRDDRLKELARAYPRRVAGTPTEFNFDAASRVFTLMYDTRSVSGAPLAANAQTEIVLPVRHYPTGYSVTASGASVVSSAGDGILRLVNVAGAARVSVTVQP